MSRLFMVVLNAIGIGAITAVIATVLMSSLRDPGAPGAYNLLLFFIFAAALLTESSRELGIDVRTGTEATHAAKDEHGFALLRDRLGANQIARMGDLDVVDR